MRKYLTNGPLWGCVGVIALAGVILTGCAQPVPEEPTVPDYSDGSVDEGPTDYDDGWHKSDSWGIDYSDPIELPNGQIVTCIRYQYESTPTECKTDW